MQYARWWSMIQTAKAVLISINEGNISVPFSKVIQQSGDKTPRTSEGLARRQPTTRLVIKPHSGELQSAIKQRKLRPPVKYKKETRQSTNHGQTSQMDQLKEAIKHPKLRKVKVDNNKTQLKASNNNPSKVSTELEAVFLQIMPKFSGARIDRGMGRSNSSDWS